MPNAVSDFFDSSKGDGRSRDAEFLIVRGEFIQLHINIGRYALADFIKDGQGCCGAASRIRLLFQSVDLVSKRSDRVLYRGRFREGKSVNPTGFRSEKMVRSLFQIVIGVCQTVRQKTKRSQSRGQIETRLRGQESVLSFLPRKV